MEDKFIIQNGVLEAYTLRENLVEVPNEVKIIGKGAFKGCVSIEQITLPETVTDIMDDAFKGCRKLKKINFPSKLTHIGEYAFHRCHSLHSVKLPSTVKYLESCAFLYCDNLEQISMPGVTKLGKQVFSNDTNLREIEVSNDLNLSCICDVFTGCSKISKITLSNGTTYNIESVIDIISSHSNIHPVIKTIAADIYRMMKIEDAMLLRFLINVKDVEIPNGITTISKSCFFDKKGIVSVKLPKTLKDIGSKAFRNCINLEKVEFASEDVTINADAFKNCTTLKYITLSNGNTYELKGLPDKYNENFPEIIHTIHSQILNNFFISGTTLMQYRGKEERVVIPEGITVIGEKAFAGNEIIGRVILPASIKEIHEEAFVDCVLLQTITLPEGLEYIGQSAFENCVKLIHVKLPESLNKIENSVFNRCKNLNEVLFGSNIKEIASLAFYGCNSLKNVHLPEKLISIGDMAFYKCVSLKEITLPKSLVKLGNNVFTYSGIKSASVNCDLKECGTDVFSECSKLRKLTFGEGVKNIGDKFAFKCISLKYVNLPSTIEYIGRNAFEDSIYIKELMENTASNIFIDGSELSGNIVLPDGMTAIAGGAFYGNAKITSVNFPNSLAQIGSRAFCGCTSLKDIVLPSGVSVLEEGVFSYCTSLESVKSQSKIKYISDNAFYGCSAIKQVPSSNAIHIGKNAFNGCKKLDNIQLNCQDIQADAFRNTAFLDGLRVNSSLIIVSNTLVDGKCCTGDVIVPEGIISISPYAFSGNDNITSITLPESLKIIGSGAFSGCKSIKELVLPSIKSIEKKSFEKCVSLAKVSGCAEIIGEGAFSYCTNLEDVILNKTVSLKQEAFCGCAALKTCECNELQYIGDNCFNECIALETFDFSNVKFIGVSAFSSCNSLKNIYLNENTYAASHAFEDCANLKEIILSGEGLKYGSYAFSGCTAINAIYIGNRKYITDEYLVIFKRNIPDIVKSIYNSAMSCFNIDENLSLFRYINKGSLIHIPKGIKRIEREVFKDAMNLKEVYISEDVEYIGERAFYNTMWLEKQKSITPIVIVNNILIDASSCHGNVLIPEYVKIVSGWAFVNCYDLREITFSSSKTIIEEYAFRNCINFKKVTLADGREYRLTKIQDRENEMLPQNVKQIFMDCLNCFKTDENNVLVECTGNINNLVLPEGITDIYDNVFEDSNLLTHITLTKDTVTIGKSAFKNCKWLVSVKNAGSIKKIEKFAFSGCYILESIEFSNNLQYIGMRAFEYSSLKNIQIPEGITEIPEKAFYRCKNLKKVSLPSTLKNIGKEAFAFCYELTEINFPENLEKIDSRAFAWCSKIDIEHLPEHVSVKDDTFSFRES
ncbi:leucine rich repeats containing protein [Clostridium carboxidivorans P7]|nr:leucine rich repeats containing protein [Clostridium carboxidivorans P7]